MANPNAKPPVETQFKPGESGNPNGRPVGSRNLSAIIRDLLEDGELDWEKLPIKDAKSLASKHGRNGWEALVYVAVAQGLAGNLKALDWLRKSQYGNRLVIEPDTDAFKEKREDMGVIFGILRRPTANDTADNSDNQPDAPTEA